MADRVRFKNPPVVEVVCGATFAPIEGLLAAHVGGLWDRFRADLPKAREMPPIAQVIERFADVPAMPSVQFEVTDRPDLPRTWFVSQDERELVQHQRDRLIYNWKRPDHQAVDYTQYEDVIESFERKLDTFVGFLRDHGLGEPSYLQFELTYVNHILNENGLIGGPDGGVLADHVRDNSRKRFLPAPETYRWATVYQMPDQQGRLHIVADSVLRASTRERMLRLNLTARGIGSDTGRAGVRPWFDLAHEWVTQGFVDITSPEVRRNVWEQEQ
jgi:uncharacterized protein (TIGR04255 family)